MKNFAARTVLATTTLQYDHDELDPIAEKGRMATHVCEDHGFWGKDPCSVNAFGTFSY